jgi:hypothetical protein
MLVVGRPLVVPELPVLFAAVSVPEVPLMNGGSAGSEQALRTSRTRAGSEGRMAWISFGRGKTRIPN